MTLEDLKTKTADELAKIILDLRKAQLNARFQKSQGTLENTAEVRKNRREIARAKTLLNQKRREAGEKAASGKKKAA